MSEKKNLKKRIIISAVIVALVAAIVAGVFIFKPSADLPTQEQALALVENAADSAVGANADIAKEVVAKTRIKVNSVKESGTGCDINLTVEHIDFAAVLENHADEITALDEPDSNGNTLKSDEVKKALSVLSAQWLEETESESVTVDAVCALVDGKWQVHCSKDFVNAVTGNLADYSEEIKGTEVKSLKRLATLINVRFDENELDTRTSLQRTWDGLKSQFKLNFIEENRWQLIVNGFLNTLKITAVALVIGIVIGIAVAAVRSSFDKNGEEMKKRGGIGYGIIVVINAICKLYLTIIRGTPVVVQLLIYYFIIFVSLQDGTVVAMLAFGINSGAYVAEIFRGGIMSIDNGQFEAGRSLGFNYVSTMIHVIIPQVFKAVLPTLCNEFITLLKETSIAGYVGIVDLTKAGDLIRGRTFSAFMPLIAVALVYLVVVVLLTWLVGKLERRLRKSER